MCYQNLTAFACGHFQYAVDVECAEAFDQPFYIKFLCPNYRSETESVVSACGHGKFYCALSSDGVYLDRLFNHLLDIDSCLRSTSTSFGDFHHTFNQFAHPNVTSMSHSLSFEQSHRLRAIYDYRNAVQVQEELLKEKSMVTEVITEAARHYGRLTEHLQSGGNRSTFPAFALPQKFDPCRHFNSQTPATAHDIVQPKSVKALKTSTPSTGRKRNRSVQSRTRDVVLDLPLYQDQTPKSAKSGSYHSPVKSRSSKSPLKNEIQEQPRAYKLSHSPEKPLSNLDDYAEFQSSASTDIIPQVRRSARVRNKRVSYAESEGSSQSQRGSSPSKSNYSIGSPSKSCSFSLNRTTTVRQIPKSKSRGEFVVNPSGSPQRNGKTTFMTPTMDDRVDADSEQHLDCINTAELHSTPALQNMGKGSVVSNTTPTWFMPSPGAHGLRYPQVWSSVQPILRRQPMNTPSSISTTSMTGWQSFASAGHPTNTISSSPFDASLIADEQAHSSAPSYHSRSHILNYNILQRSFSNAAFFAPPPPLAMASEKPQPEPRKRILEGSSSPIRSNKRPRVLIPKREDNGSDPGDTGATHGGLGSQNPSFISPSDKLPRVAPGVSAIEPAILFDPSSTTTDAPHAQEWASSTPYHKTLFLER